MDYRFKADEWNRLTREARVHRCRLLAAEAERLSAKAPVHMKDGYVVLARNWLQLANEIEEHG